ncbi:hypothetical protein ABT364_26260 [Massilia sp. SR12]
MKTLLILLGSAFLLTGCGGGGHGNDSSAADSNAAEGFTRTSHWEIPELNFGMTSSRVKTRRTVLLYNDGKQGADFSLMYNLSPELEGKGCRNTQPGTACQVEFWWKPTQNGLLSGSVYPTREQSLATGLPVQGAAFADTTYALAPFWTAAGQIQWEGEANFTPSHGHSVIATRIAWSSGGLGAKSQCEAEFKGNVAAYLNGQVLQVEDARFALSQGESFTRNGETFTRYQARGDVSACDLASLDRSTGNYILNI